MRCKGYYAWMNAGMFNTSTSAITTAGNSYTFGNSYNTAYSWTLDRFQIRVGKGTTEALVTDIDIAEYFPDNTVSYSSLTGNKTINAETGILAVTFNVAVTNVSKDTIELKEAGLFWYYSSSSRVLLARQVFDDPIELFPNETTYIRARLI